MSEISNRIPCAQCNGTGHVRYGEIYSVCDICNSCGKVPAPTSTVDHPKHYNSHPSGVECIVVVEHFGFNVGNAVKYLWRCGLKGDEIEDLKKALWYVQREIEKREKAKVTHEP